MAGIVINTLFIILLLVTLASSATQYIINSSQLINCYTSLSTRCSFHDPSLWQLNVAPSSFSDAAVITYTDTENPVSLVISNSSFILSSITISGPVTIEISENVNVQLGGWSNNNNGILVLKNGAMVEVNGTANIINSQLQIGDFASYTHNLGNFILGANSTLTSNANSSLHLLNADIAGVLALQITSSFVGNVVNLFADQYIAAFTSIQVLNTRVANVSFVHGLACGTLNGGSGALAFYGPVSASLLLLSSSVGQMSVYSSVSADNVTAISGYTLFVNETLTSNFITTRDGGLILANGVVTANDVRISGGATHLYGGLATNTLHVGLSAQFTVETVFNISQAVNVTNSSTITLKSAIANINGTNLGAGNFLVNGSRITLQNSYVLPNARLTFAGSSFITAPRLDIYKFLYYDSSAFVTARVLDGIYFNSSTSFPGTLYAHTFLNTTAPITIQGALVLVSCTAFSQGTLSATSLNITSSKLTLASDTTLNTTALYVDPSSSLISLFSNSILGQFVNAGELSSNANNPLTLIGKFTQLRTGVITLSKINRGRPAFIAISGSASVAGDIKYEPLAIASGETVKLRVITTSSGLTGKFNNPTRVFERFDYDASSAYIVFSENAAGIITVSFWAVLFVCLSLLL